MDSEANTAHISADTIPFQPMEGLFLKLQILRHEAIVGIAVGHCKHESYKPNVRCA
jgi:hypothetical protein